MRWPDRVTQKLDSCRPYYERLLELRPTLVSGKATWVEWAAAERCLHLAIECAIDVGEMLVSWRRLPLPEDNKQVFRTLGDAGVLDRDLAERLAGAAGLRNILVHRYGDIDRERLKQTILRDLKDLETFAVEVERLVEREGLR